MCIENYSKPTYYTTRSFTSVPPTRIHARDIYYILINKTFRQGYIPTTICIQTFYPVVFHGSPLKQPATTTATNDNYTAPTLFRPLFWSKSWWEGVKSFSRKNDSITATGYREFGGRDIYGCIYIYTVAVRISLTRHCT